VNIDYFIRGKIAHFVALLTVVLWSLTFVQTKVLLQYISPTEILLDRFVIAWVLFWILDARFLATSIKEELLFALLGATGIFGYYIFENLALEYTKAIHVGLIVTIAPLFTALLTLFVKPLKRRNILHFIKGFIPVSIGLYIIGFEHFNSVNYGDFLALLGALSFALYTILLSYIHNRFDAFIVTRKSFFYGIIFLSIYAFVEDMQFHWSVYSLPQVWGNMLFLATVASGLCFIMWRWAVTKIGSSSASAYIYLVPLINALAAVLVLQEELNLKTIIAGVFILSGLIIYQRQK